MSSVLPPCKVLEGRGSIISMFASHLSSSWWAGSSYSGRGSAQQPKLAPVNVSLLSLRVQRQNLRILRSISLRIGCYWELPSQWLAYQKFQILTSSITLSALFAAKYLKVKVRLLSHVWLFTTPWTVAHQAHCLKCYLALLFILIIVHHPHWNINAMMAGISAILSTTFFPAAIMPKLKHWVEKRDFHTFIPTVSSIGVRPHS